ncbi:MAG: ABC transporter permease [Propionibacteriaceae bacterium]|jgi:putative ABC transport system permease protein|nr:ABC transporter permease [Propionibacteriaceae bacterium]
MNFLQILRTAWSAVSTHRMRSALTIIGILIGIAAVSLTVGLGQGTTAAVTNQISSLGSNLLTISPGSSTSGGIRGGSGSATTLTIADANALASTAVAPSIAGVAPIMNSNQVVSTTSTNWTTQVIGTTDAWVDVRSRTIQVGRFLDADDLTNATTNVVVGTDTATELFTEANMALGQSVTIGSSDFTVVGVLVSSGTDDDMVLMPYTTMSQRLTGGVTTVSSIYISATSANTLSAAYQQAEATLLTRHGLTSDNADFSISSMQSVLSTMSSILGTLTVVLAALAGVSLVVGGIGVMNIMLVSVTERVREIGLRKALGATPGVIRLQFLFEAVMLALIGGVLGIGLGYLAGWLVSKAVSVNVSISWAACALALGVSALVGIIAGVYPASRAAKLAPIDALRSE